MRSTRRSLLRAGIGTAFLATARPALAAWPERPMRFVVPLAAGGSVDLLTRQVAERLQHRLGAPVVVENRGGAAGNIGIDLVARAAPDGYTALVASDALTVNPTLQPVTWDATRSFVPSVLLCRAPQVLLAHPSLGVRDLGGLLTEAEKRKGRLNIASPGNASSGHLAGALMQVMTHGRWTHVPYRGGGPAVSDALAGHVDAIWVTAAPVVPHIRSGALVPLAVSTKERARGLCCKLCSGPQVAWVASGSGSNLEQLGDEGGLGPHVAPINPPKLPLSHHRHHLVARQCSSCRMETAEAEPWSDQAFHAPVVLFHDVIEKLALPQAGEAP